MDKIETRAKKNWAWMSEFMPRIVTMLGERRAKGEGVYIDECWKHGVRLQEPGWFYAREGGITVGTPFNDLESSELLREYGTWEYAKGQALLMLRPTTTEVAT